MGEGKIKAQLSSAAKVGERWIPSGNQDVTADELAVLKAAGLLVDDIVATGDPESEDVRTFTVAEWEAAVSAMARELVGQAFDGKGGQLEAEVKDILAKAGAETAELQARLAETEAARANLEELAASLRQANNDLTAQLNARAESLAPDAAGEKPPETAEAGEAPARTYTPPSTPPSEKAAKTAPQKGAAATTRG